MARYLRNRGIGAGLLTLIVALLFAVAADAEEEDGLVPSFIDGRLVIVGAGFRASEQITVSVDIDGAISRFAITADEQGSFRLATGLAVGPGAGVKLEARGTQGTTKAAIASAPGQNQPPGLPKTGAGSGSAPVARGLLVIAVLGSTLVSAGLWLHVRRWAQR